MTRIALLILTLLSALPSAAQARVQRDLVCWVPDCEFPVDCDDEED